MPVTKKPSVAELQQTVVALTRENARLTTELSASLDRQTAVSEILHSIASTPAEAGNPLDAIAHVAARMFEASSVTVRTLDGEILRYAGAAGPAVEKIREALPEGPLRRNGTAGRAIHEKRAIVISDLDNPEPDVADMAVIGPARAAGSRSLVAMPLLRQGEAVGALIVHRADPTAYSDKDLTQLADFADQAVIAIENARLLTELRESLERQTATADILRVIASTPGDPTRALDKIAETAARMFGAQGVTFRRVEADVLRTTGVTGRAQPFPRDTPRGEPSAAWNAVLHNRQLHLELRGDRFYDVDNPQQEIATLPGPAYANWSVFTPLSREGEAIGCMCVFRIEPPFGPDELEMMRSFADQAVIAIENARLLDELNARNRDLAEALDTQTASADILRAIASEPADPKNALTQICETAARMFGASNVGIRRLEGDNTRALAAAGAVSEQIRDEMEVTRFDPSSPFGISIVQKRVVHIRDTTQPANQEERTFSHSPPWRLMRGLGVRSSAIAPLVREGTSIGTMFVHRTEVRPFTERELALLQIFADQAVIAIENARLLGELRASLERQTATSEVLGVISASPDNLQPVFDSMLENAVRLCEAAEGALFRVSGDVLHRVATQGTAPGPHPGIPIATEGPAGRMMSTRSTVHIHDITSEEHGEEPSVFHVALAMERGVRSRLWVPMLKDGVVIGAFLLNRREVHPFTDELISLVESFARQAVIAIENARLLTELRESLDRQTATANILRVIASTPGDATRALDTIAETAARMFDVESVAIRRRDGDMLRIVGAAGSSTIARENLLDIPLDRFSPWAAGIAENHQVHIDDTMQRTDRSAAFPGARHSDAQGIRTSAFTPLTHDGRPVGVMIVSRREHRPFRPDELELMRSFADQAVIAIENARLLTELRKSLDRRTAIAEVLQVISSSPGDVQPVFETMLENAVRLCEAIGGSIFVPEDGALRRIASRGAIIGVPIPTGAPMRMLESKRTVHVPDLLAEFKRQYQTPEHIEAAERAGVRSGLWVPMVKDGEVVAAFVLNRNEPRAFTESQIGLVENFASQAVIAIENARLLAELREARDAAERALVDLRAAQANLIQAEKMASLGQLTAGIAHEIKNPLNFVNNFADLSVELLDELKEAQAAAAAALDADKRAEMDELIQTITGNLAKIAEHGRRADGIVKSMLAHSRGGAGDRQTVDLNHLVDEALNLAYHGARAQDQSFNIALERDFDPALGPVDVVPQDLTRVFLNLFGNGFYAANKRRREGTTRPSAPPSR